LAVGPLAAGVVGFLLARMGYRIAAKGERVLVWFVIVASVYSSFTLGTNDVSNAASFLVTLNQLPVRLAGLYGGAFMALGVLTWGQRLLERISRDILKFDVPLAATSQLAQAISLTVINGVGYNASINQSIVGGLTGSSLAIDRNKLNWKVILNNVLNWTTSPVLGLACSAVITVILHAIFGSRPVHAGRISVTCLKSALLA